MLARKNIALLLVFLLLISLFACVIGLYIKGEKVSEIPTIVHRYPEDNYIEIVGRALEGAGFFGPPFFRFFVEVDPSGRYEVEGFNRTVTLGDISWGPELHESPNWGGNPFVRVFGREVDNKIIAYIVDVGINGSQEWRPYYWMSILTRPERRTLRVLVKYVEKSVWIHGALSENDLLWELVYENRERFQVPDNYLGMEAWALGRYRGAGGLGFVVNNLFVEQDGIYLEIYPEEYITVTVDKKVYSPGDMQVVTIKNQSDEVIEFMGLRFDLVWEKWDGTTWQHYKSIIQEGMIRHLQPGEEGDVTESLRLYTGEEFAIGKYRVGTAANGLVSGKRYGPAYAEFEVQAAS